MFIRLGYGEMVEGVEGGLYSMCVNETRAISIPPEKAFGADGIPSTVPTEARVRYYVRLLPFPEGASTSMRGSRINMCIVVMMLIMHAVTQVSSRPSVHPASTGNYYSSFTKTWLR